MSRLETCFAHLKQAKRTGLVAYIAAGDPSAELTVPLMHALVAAGTDVIELGVPFSDPMADGPVIQRAAERALQNGVSLTHVLEMVHSFRQRDVSTPIVLMGYANPIEAMGYADFVRKAKAAQVDGVLVVDYPPEECEDFSQQLKAAEMDPIFLLAPTSTPKRIQQVGELGRGYIYYVSLKGVTGAGHLNVAEVEQRVASMREQIQRPIAVGFGIRDAQSASQIAKVADAIVIGSRIIEEIENSPREEVLTRVSDFIQGIRSALDKSDS